MTLEKEPSLDLSSSAQILENAQVIFDQVSRLQKQGASGLNDFLTWLTSQWRAIAQAGIYQGLFTTDNKFYRRCITNNGVLAIKGRKEPTLRATFTQKIEDTQTIMAFYTDNQNRLVGLKAVEVRTYHLPANGSRPQLMQQRLLKINLGKKIVFAGKIDGCQVNFSYPRPTS